MNILGIETSCDETSASVLGDGKVRSNIVSSQRCHTDFGGVVPELASREHERLIVSIVESALTEANITKNDLDVIAATAGPGLIGAVMVGLCFAEGLAWSLGKPFVPVNHVEAHIFSPFISDEAESRTPVGDFISLTVSGGHTLLSLVHQNLDYQIIGRTIDDAAGEAFDKTGKMLGLGYPAGPAIDRLAKEGNSEFHRFPRALTSSSRSSQSYRGNFDFSFSGMKTSVLTWLGGHDPDFVQEHLADLAASIQDAIVSVLVEKSIAAAILHKVSSVSVAGGVSANSGLRSAMKTACDRNGLDLLIPALAYSTDNAAMIASMAQLMIARGKYRPEQNSYGIAPFARFVRGEKGARLK